MTQREKDSDNRFLDIHLKKQQEIFKKRIEERNAMLRQIEASSENKPPEFFKDIIGKIVLLNKKD